jgi:putative copper resistance protein D
VHVTGWEAAAALAKAVTYAATLGAAGAIFFLNYNESVLQTAQRQRIQRGVVQLVIVAVVASVAKVLALSGSMSDDVAGMVDASFVGMILHAGEGRASGMRLVGLSVCAAVMFATRLTDRVAALGALLAAGSFAAVGHVHALKPDAGATLLLLVHLWCGAFWLGALWPLLQVARDGDGAQIARVAARFGNIALFLVAALIAAGVFMLFRLLGSMSALWAGAYGRMLSVKLLLVAALLCAAALNKLHLTPRLAAGDAKAGLSLRRSIRTELAAAVMILLVTAALTTFAGPG